MGPVSVNVVPMVDLGRLQNPQQRKHFKGALPILQSAPGSPGGSFNSLEGLKEPDGQDLLAGRLADCRDNPVVPEGTVAD